MVTKQLLKRDLFGSEISQNSLNGFFSANDLVKAGNNWRISKNLPLFKLGPYLQYDSVKEFIHFLEEQEGQKVLFQREKCRHLGSPFFIYKNCTCFISRT